jgi:hypothetical protein
MSDQPSLRDQANKAALESVKADKPSSFTVGGHYDGNRITGGATYQRTWKNGWGATAYARAWWEDKPVIPQKKSDVVVGAEGTYKF